MLPKLGKRGIISRWLTPFSGCLVLFGLLLCSTTPAHAAAVLVMANDAHVSMKDDPFVSAAVVMPARSPVVATGAHAARAKTPAPGTVGGALDQLRRINAISGVAYRAYLGDFQAALRTERTLTGARAAELESVTVTLHNIAVAGLLTPSRLPALFLTLMRNRQWWARGPMLSYGQRVEFAGSQ
ncbi:MAG: hypothetical protein ACLP50_07585, partial [Solirubrobacteraceae bacterium]